MVFDPLSFGLSAGASLISGIVGAAGQSSANRAAEEQTDLQNRAAMQAYRYNWQETKGKYRYDKDSVKIQRRNIEQELTYQDQTAAKSWNYQMQIRAFDYNNQLRAYEQRKMTAGQQMSFNGLAYDFALQDVARWEQEQNLQLDFEDKSTMMEYKYAQLGQAMAFQEADMVRQQARAAGQLQQQETYVQALKASGEAVARGASGATAEKLASASIAEAGLRTSSIIQQVFNAEQNFGLTSAQIGMKLEQLNDQFYLDKAQLAASRISLTGQAISMRANAAMSKFQADLNAAASIGFEPAIPPMPPKPDILPRPTLQNPYKPTKPPAPVKGVAATTSPFYSFAQTAIPGIAKAAVSAYTPTNGMNQQQQQYSWQQYNPYNNPLSRQS